MRILTLFIIFIVFVIALIFSILNFHSVEIHLYLATISLPLTVALTIAFFLGILLGATAAFIYIVKLKAQYANLKKMLNKAEKQ